MEKNTSSQIPSSETQQGVVAPSVVSGVQPSFWVWLVGLVMLLLLGGIAVLSYMVVSLKKEVTRVENNQTSTAAVTENTNTDALTVSNPGVNTNTPAGENTNTASVGATKTRIFAQTWGGGKTTEPPLEIYRIDSSAKGPEQIFHSFGEDLHYTIFGITDTGQVVYREVNNKEGKAARGYVKIYTPATQESENLVQTGNDGFMGGIVSPDGKFFVYNSAGGNTGDTNFIYRYDLTKREPIQIFEQTINGGWYEPNMWLDDEWFLSIYTSMGSDAPAYRKQHTLINALTAATKDITFEGTFDSRPVPTYDHKAFTYTTFDYDVKTKKSVARIKTVDLNGVTKTLFETSRFQYGSFAWLDQDTLVAFAESTDTVEELPFSAAGYGATGKPSLRLIHVNKNTEEALVTQAVPGGVSAIVGDVVFYETSKDGDFRLHAYNVTTGVDKAILSSASLIFVSRAFEL